MPSCATSWAEADGKRVDGALRRRVVDVLARRAEPGRTRREIDDGAAASAVARRHAAHRFARAEERSDDVGGEDPHDTRRIHRLDAHLRLEDAGIVDQRRHRAECPVAGLEQPDDVGLDGDVTLNCDGAATRRDDGGDDGIGRVLRDR